MSTETEFLALASKIEDLNDVIQAVRGDRTVLRVSGQSGDRDDVGVIGIDLFNDMARRLSNCLRAGAQGSQILGYRLDHKEHGVELSLREPDSDWAARGWAVTPLAALRAPPAASTERMYTLVMTKAVVESPVPGLPILDGSGMQVATVWPDARGFYDHAGVMIDKLNAPAADAGIAAPAADTFSREEVANRLISIQEDLTNKNDRDVLGYAAYYLRAAPPAPSADAVSSLQNTQTSADAGVARIMGVIRSRLKFYEDNKSDLTPEGHHGALVLTNLERDLTGLLARSAAPVAGADAERERLRATLAAATVDLISSADKDEDPLEWTTVREAYAVLGLPINDAAALASLSTTATPSIVNKLDEATAYLLGVHDYQNNPRIKSALGCIAEAKGAALVATGRAGDPNHPSDSATTGGGPAA